MHQRGAKGAIGWVRLVMPSMERWCTPPPLRLPQVYLELFSFNRTISFDLKLHAHTHYDFFNEEARYEHQT
jgi:hypothetical protein